jgi:hypothetical protein
MNNNGQLCETTPDTHISQVRGSTLTPLIEGMGGMTTKCSNQWQAEGVGLLVFSNKEEMTRERNNNILKL